jgi:hypothetical protein
MILLETTHYLASMVALFFIYIIILYVTAMGWMLSEFLTPIGQLLGLCALIYTAIFIVSKIKGE